MINLSKAAPGRSRSADLWAFLGLPEQPTQAATQRRLAHRTPASTGGSYSSNRGCGRMRGRRSP